MRLLPATALALLLVTGTATVANAEVLKTPAPHPPAAPAPSKIIQIKMPVKGMTMNEVLKRFGPPQKRLAPVGDPPITRWVYSDYIVYFEYKYVIHSVLTRK